MIATKEEFFNPVKLSARDKAAATDHTARAIIDAEATEREKKTEKLRALRMQQQPQADAEPATPKKRGRAPAAK